jgi:membrane associated rhomboid family serine protease
VDHSSVQTLLREGIAAAKLVPWPFWIPAWLYIIHQLFANAMLGELIQEDVVIATVNVFAHLGGAGGGLLFIYFFLHPEIFAQRR